MVEKTTKKKCKIKALPKDPAYGRKEVKYMEMTMGESRKSTSKRDISKQKKKIEIKTTGSPFSVKEIIK